MPLDTSNAEKLNLPDQRTGSRSANPYVELYCSFIISKKRKSVEISIGKDLSFRATLDIDSGDEQYDIDKDVKLSLDKKNYSIGTKMLFEQYVDSKIIQDDGALNKSMFRKTCEKIFEHIKQNKELIGETKNAKTFFSVFIIPSKEIVKAGLTPMLSTLSIMENANSESEVLGLGLSVIALFFVNKIGISVIK